MAHSISSTRALQAAGEGEEDTHTHQDFSACLRGADMHTYLHISCLALVWPPGWSSGGGTAPRTTWTTGHLPSSCTYRFDHITGWHINRQSKEANLRAAQIFRLPWVQVYSDTKHVFFNFSFNSQVPDRVSPRHLYAFLRSSITFGEIWWRSTQLVDRMEWLFAQRPLVAGRPSTSAQLQKGATFNYCMLLHKIMCHL